MAIIGNVAPYVVWHARLAGLDEETGLPTWGPWEQTLGLLPLEIIDPAAPKIPRAKLQWNHPLVNDHVWNWPLYFGADDKVAIVEVVPEGSLLRQPNILFLGTIADVDYQWTTQESCVVTAVGMPARLASDRQYRVYGRDMSGANTATKLMEAFECSFNHGGKKNMRWRDSTDGVPKFCDDNGYDAEWWRIYDAVGYLCWCWIFCFIFFFKEFILTNISICFNFSNYIITNVCCVGITKNTSTKFFYKTLTLWNINSIIINPYFTCFIIPYSINLLFFKNFFNN